MEGSHPENEEQPQSTSKADEQRPPEQLPEDQCTQENQLSEVPTTESPEGELFPEAQTEDRPPECLSRKKLFQDRPPMEQPPCGVGKHKLEEGSFRERLARSRPQFRGDIHGKNLSNEEMIQAADDIEEMKRVRNKLLIMHWKAKRSRPYPI